MIDRFIVMLIPLIALLSPLFKLLPPLYEWRISSRIYRWYEALQAVDEKYKANSRPFNTASLALNLKVF